MTSESRCDFPLWQCPGSHAPRGRGPGGKSHLVPPVELRCMGSVRRTRNTKRSEKTDHFHVTSDLRGSCELRARLMRCFDGSEQQRRDPHTSRAQRARGRCAIVHLKPRMVSPWRFSKNVTGFVTSRSESSLNLPQHGYHSIVAPWFHTRSAPVPHPFRTRSAPVPHPFHTRSAPVLHQCRTGAAAVPSWFRPPTKPPSSPHVGAPCAVCVSVKVGGRPNGGRCRSRRLNDPVWPQQRQCVRC